MKYSSTKALSTRDRWRVFIAVVAVAYLGYLVSITPAVEETLNVAKYDPPFGLAGTGLERFSREIQKLEQSVGALAEVYPDPADKKIITEALHPVAFLKTLPALEESRRAFVADPSATRRAAYRGNLKKTAQEYEKSVSAYRDALTAFPRKGAGNEVYNFVGSATSLGRLIGAADKLLANARQLKQELRTGKTKHIPPVEPWRASSSERPLAETGREDLAFVRRFVESHEGWKAITPAFEVPTDCFGEPGEPDFFYVVQLRNELVPLYFKPAYFRYTTARFSGSRYYKPLRDAGLDYYWQPDFNLYMCPDLAYQAEVMTLHKIQTLLDGWGGFKPAARDTPEASLVENAIWRFLNQDPLRRPTQLELFNSIAALFSRYKYKTDELEALLGTKNARIISEIRLLERQKTGFLEEIAARGARLTANLPELMRRLPEPLSAQELLIMRSYPSLYFLPFNYSVWRADEPLQFIDSVELSRFYDSREELKERYSDEKIMELMRVSAHLILR